MRKTAIADEFGQRIERSGVQIDRGHATRRQPRQGKGLAAGAATDVEDLRLISKSGNCRKCALGRRLAAGGAVAQGLEEFLEDLDLRRQENRLAVSRVCVLHASIRCCK
jgi:hypothetical protein